MSNQNFNQTFNIIRNVGSPNEATTKWGFKVFKVDKVFVQSLVVMGQEFNGFVPVIDYGNHFCYELPDRVETVGLPAYMCSCGSFAVFFGSDAYKNEASPQGLVLGCYYRHNLFDIDKGEFFHRHADGSK